MPAMHLLSAIATIYGTPENRDLIRSQRNIEIQGYYTLSDLIVGDVFKNEWDTLTGFDRMYERSVRWNKIYVPSVRENAIIYRICYEWYQRGPVPILEHTDNFVLERMSDVPITSYIKASVAASGALRSLMGNTVREIEILCENILLSIGVWIESESNVRKLILNEVFQRKQNKLKKSVITNMEAYYGKNDPDKEGNS